MPRTIDEGFRDFLAKLTPSTTETEAAKKHRASIEQCLKNNFDLRRFWRIGSLGNGTSISGHSDTDYMASLGDLTSNSNASLQKTKNVLAERFPNTGVAVRCPAVKVPFGALAQESTEVVPGDLVSTKPHFVYDIPDCNGGWMKTSPDAHNAYVRGVNDNHSRKVKPLIRFTKAWKYYQSVPISSFYLEMRVAKYCAGESSIIYCLDIEYFLRRMLNGKLVNIQDPAGVSGYIKPCSSDATHEDALSKLRTAVTRAQKANEAKKDGDIKKAFEWWDRLYADRFPSYYK